MFPYVVGRLISNHDERLLHDDGEVVGRKLLLELLNVSREVSVAEGVGTACVSGRVCLSLSDRLGEGAKLSGWARVGGSWLPVSTTCVSGWAGSLNRTGGS
jgi:hypothetical protein